MEKKWWHNSVVYQIYPRSFKDSNGDGIGDLKGIISKLDYIKFLGVDVLWISPIYKSPNVDNGYDISDYCDIMDEFGTMDDMKLLIKEAKSRDIKIMMDLVVNHTSDEHKWFKESRKSRDNEYRDFYVWRNPVNGDVPSSLKSNFGGSAWTLDKSTGQYYLHMHDKKQPDLNWDNQRVREKIYEMMNFWLDLGIEGFRMDVIELIGKDVDNLLIVNGPNLHTYIQEMNKMTFGDRDIITVGETWAADTNIAKLYCDPKRKELGMVFQFEVISMDKQPGKRKWDLAPLNFVEFKKIFSKWQTELHSEGWNSLFGNNHDLPRMVSRWGNDKEYRMESAKMLATMLHMQKGTPYIYQGEEIGMTNIRFDSIDDYNDIESLNMYKERLSQGYSLEEIMESIYAKGRDNARTPMQWSKENNAGFTTGTPWLKVNKNYKYINVEQAINDENSILYYYKKLIKLRRESDVIKYGDYKLILEEHPEIFAYTRSWNDDNILVICNFYGNTINVFLGEEYSEKDSQIILSNYKDAKILGRDIKLRPYEAIVYKVV
ncbi:MAG: alpha-glucosidase [Clostridium celatum]|uniref:glycoside hydrolase family 13 protein n=1 Tax=Clostridium sp. TaxID=1506 RepID=UPI0025BF7251|nr:alpha-glucosidase [Clostridium sp.]MBS4957256.1 alpha-glucosidase [Clostridium sp.]MDU2123962.1 alpha-glucosidase [Clostridium celatum]MDU4980734.1 alpha-glucosidase [Clostridium celatum]